jgi:uncharacterized protein
MTEPEITVQRDEAEGRYEIRVGDVLAGFSDFHIDARGRAVFTHTEVDPAYEGRGLAKNLVAHALTDVVERGETLVPRCPFVRRYIQRNEIPGLVVEDADSVIERT